MKKLIIAVALMMTVVLCGCSGSGGGSIGSATTATHTLSGTITEYTVPTASSAPEIITAGPDGNLWFADKTNNTINRISTTGAIVEYLVSTTASFPLGITTGP